MSFINKVQVKEIKLKDKRFSFLLSQISGPPKVLHVVGNEKILNNKAITVIGSRKMTVYGRETTKRLVRDLVDKNFVIVSGLARGIDGVAHRSCLEAGGKTIAVLGHGFDRIYPPEHRGLAKQIIIKGGCLVTEFPYNFPIKKQNFILRNRIMAGMSLGTLVIEGKKKSGTKITATMAADYGREVFCVPGPIESKLSEGPAQLIQQGAKLVIKVEDILEELLES
ncbi:MAG: DNA-processing protein DprA [Patescibacteria group bacterium]|nr:DNA-processing protein DprA [Patescibacteria group bacterium]